MSRKKLYAKAAHPPAEEIPATGVPPLSTPAPAQPSNPEKFLEEQFATLSTSAQRGLDDLAAYTQHQPQQALLIALGVGYLLRVLPTVRILGGLIRLAVVLVKPVGLIYGASKVWRLLQENSGDHTREVS